MFESFMTRRSFHWSFSCYQQHFLCMYLNIYSFQTERRQHEDLLKVYEWFLSHQKLISEDTVSPSSS